MPSGSFQPDALSFFEGAGVGRRGPVQNQGGQIDFKPRKGTAGRHGHALWPAARQERKASYLAPVISLPRSRDSPTLFPFYFIHLFIFNCIYSKSFQNGGKLLPRADACSGGKDRTAPRPQCMSLHVGRKDSGLGDAVIRFPCVSNQGHERWGNGAGLEELASALRSDVGDGAASRLQQSLFTSDHILTPPLFPPPVRVCDLYFSHLSGTMQLFPHAFPSFLFQL